MTPFKLIGMRWLNGHTMSLTLQPQQPYPFRAGQYLTLPFSSSPKAMSYSIASRSPREKEGKCGDIDAIEIQIGGILPDSELAVEITHFRAHRLNQEPFLLGQAAGEAYFRSAGRPISVIAGGSGFSYAKSIVLEALSQPTPPDITLFWGGKRLSDLYEHEAMIALSQAHPQLHYVPVVELLSSDDMTNLVEEAGLHQGRLLDIFFANSELRAEQDIYICGRYQMVQTAYQQIQHANPELAKRIYSDALPPAHG
ncbi:hypothetical protein PTW35_18820 (plasmid) [Photobacterium sp. DA100]|uniref:hypothetical protein n=1 Tax=Photobacterium sp. DA100 TaxID=3027472 RepID=UPI00247B115D|nr:hypothetical protein [Photobacterium sp. DA100]WEM45148.1 hypothetical protein PTW35_18820 [Photobacterium sp. DA100]